MLLVRHKRKGSFLLIVIGDEKWMPYHVVMSCFDRYNIIGRVYAFVNQNRLVSAFTK